MGNAPWARRILPLEPAWLLLLAPLLLFPGRILAPSWQWIPVVATLIFWPVRWVATGSVTVRTPLRLPVLVLLLCVPVAIWVAFDRTRAWEVAGYLVLGIAGANALLCWPAVQRRPQVIVWGLLLTALGLSLLGPLVVVDAPIGAESLRPVQEVAAPLTRLLGETINPNILANALLVGFPFALAFALRGGWTRRRWGPLPMALFALWLVALLLFTESRGAWLALFLVIPLLCCLRWPRLLWLLPIVIGAAILLLYRAGPQTLDLLASGSSISGLDERIEIWQRGVYIMQDFPFTGAGLGMFSQVVPVLYPYVLVPVDIIIPDAHNLPIQVGADLGMPGLVAWLATVIAQVSMLVIVLRRRPDALTWALAAGALGATAAVLAAGVFSAMNWGVKPAFLPWMVTALAAILHRQANETIDDR